MKEFFLNNLAMAIIFLVVVIVAAVLIVVGIVKKGFWKDLGFMKKDGKLSRWKPNVVLTIWYKKGLSNVYVKEIFDAKNLINGIIGRPIIGIIEQAPSDFSFDLFPPSGASLIAIYDDEGTDPNHGQTSFTTDEDGYIDRMKIQLPVANLNYAKPIVEHELLGHGLGLDHDESKTSFMHPIIQNRPQSMTQADKDLLKNYYSNV